MGRSKQRTVATMLTMSFVAVIVITFYYYITNRTEALEENISEVEVLLSKDLQTYYPATPKDVVKLYSKMLQTLYTDLEEEQVKDLAIKIRELYDTELLENNPQEDYLNNIYTEIIEWNNAERSITNFSFIKDKEKLTSVIDGREYATILVVYTFEERAKHLEEWRFLLRRDEAENWKILGWNKVTKGE